MLKYFISVSENLAVAGVLTGMLFAYIFAVYGAKGRRLVTAGAVLGLVAAAVMAYLKNKTKLIDTGMWNIRIFSVSLAAFVLFFLTDLGPVRKHTGGGNSLLAPLFAAVLVFCQVFYALPDVLAYPYTFVLGGQAVMSTGFIYRFIGLLLGAVLVIVAAFAVYFACLKSRVGLIKILLVAALLVTSFHQVTKILQTLLTRRIISGHNIFVLVKFTSNHATLFIFGVLLFALVAPVVLWVRSLHVTEPYENPAQHRRIKANWRSARRWSTAVLACFLLLGLNITAIKAYANRPVELSPSEECEIRGENVYVSFEQVEDGHLHRFTYTTPNGVGVRFIVIKKPNSSAYGIGLDACDICGETGYFERNGQIVCKLCDVVMNVNTIGFKGGCNPKVIDYSIENGYIIVPTATLIEHEKDFK